jgi:hypothetical protein
MEFWFFVVAVIAVGYGTTVLTRARGATTTPARASESEARWWLGRLDAGVARGPDTGNRSAAQAMHDATERSSEAHRLLGSSRSAHDLARVTQLALEGLQLLRAARTACGINPGATVPATAPALTGLGPIEIAGRAYAAAPCLSPGTPYYFPGGTVADRLVPAGWYSEPWWHDVNCGSSADASS